MDDLQNLKANEWLDEVEKNMMLRESNIFREGFDFLKDVVIVVLLVVIIRTFIALPFQINGQSMYESYYDREFIIVDKLSLLSNRFFTVWEPKRGDVLVFKPHVNKEKEYYIKRVIWLPGEWVKISDGKVYIKKIWAPEWEELSEPYLSEKNQWNTYVRSTPTAYTYEVPEWNYFVMGDNRIASTDSRSCFSSCNIEGRSNFIGRWDVVGKVFFDLWYFSFSKIGFIHPTLWIETYPRAFSSPSSFTYNID